MPSPETPMPGKSNLPSEEDLAKLADAAMGDILQDGRVPAPAGTTEPAPADAATAAETGKAPAQRAGRPVRRADAGRHGGTRRAGNRGHKKKDVDSSDPAAAVPAESAATPEPVAPADLATSSAETGEDPADELLKLMNRPDPDLAPAAPAATPDAADATRRSPAAERRRQARLSLEAEMKEKADVIQQQIDQCQDPAELVRIARLRSTDGAKRLFLFPEAGKVWDDDRWRATWGSERTLAYNFKDKISEVVRAYIQTKEQMGQSIENPFEDKLSVFTKDEVEKVLSAFDRVSDDMRYAERLALVPDRVGYAQNFTNYQGQTFRVTCTEPLYVNIERQRADGTWEAWYGQTKISPSVVSGFRKLEGVQKSGETYEIAFTPASAEPATPATPVAPASEPAAAAIEPAAPATSEPTPGPAAASVSVEAGASREVSLTLEVLEKVPEGKVAVLRNGHFTMRFVRHGSRFVNEKAVTQPYYVTESATDILSSDLLKDLSGWTLTIEELDASPAPAAAEVDIDLDKLGVENRIGERGARDYDDVRVGDEWKCLDGRVIRVLNNYSGASESTGDLWISEGSGDPDSGFSQSISRSDLSRKLRAEKFELFNATSTKKLPELEPVGPSAGEDLDGRDPQNYEDVRIGDVWEVVGGDGVVRRIKIIGEMGDGQVTYDFFDGTTLHRNETLLLKILVVSLENTRYRLKESGKGGRVVETIEAGIRWPEEGETAFFVDDRGHEFQVWKKTGQEMYFLAALAAGIPVGEPREISLENLNVHAKANGWKEKSAVENPSRTPTPEPKQPGQEASDLLAEAIRQAQEAVNVARAEYVTLQGNQDRKMNDIRRVLGRMFGKGDVDRDVVEAGERYQAALAELLTHKLEAIKQSGKTGEALKKQIAGLMREFQFVEAEQLDEDRRIERWKETPKGTFEHLERAHAFVRSIGRWYNGLPTGRKFLYAGGIAGLSVASFAVGGGVGSLFAGAVVAGRKFMAGSAAYVAVEEGANKYAKSKREKKVTENLESIIAEGNAEKLMEFTRTRKRGDSEGDLSMNGALEQKLLAALGENGVIGQAIESSIKRRQGELWRRTGAAAAGVFVGSGVLADMAKKGFGAIFGVGTAEAAGPEAAASAPAAPDQAASAARRVAPGMVAAAAGPEAAASAPPRPVLTTPPTEGGSPRLEVARPVGENSPRTGAPTPGPGVRPETVAEVKAEALLGERTISHGDTIWKYGVEAAKANGLETTQQQNRFAALLNQALQRKLELEPNLAEKAGFVVDKNGEFNTDYIRANDKLRLGALLSDQEVAALIEQAKQGVSPEGAPQRAVGAAARNVVEVAASAAPEATELPEVRFGVPGATGMGVPSDLLTSTPAAQEAVIAAPLERDVAPETSILRNPTPAAVTEYVKALPREEQLNLFRTSERALRDLLMTNDPMVNPYSEAFNRQYDLSSNPKLANVSMGRVFEDYTRLKDNPLASYDGSVNQLHFTQMRSLSELRDAVAKLTSSKVAAPLRGETVKMYLVRAAVLAKAHGATLPGFSRDMVN